MSKILFVMSSVREGRIADSIMNQVQDELKNYPNLEVSIVDFKELPLPFFDSPINPAHEGFAPENANVAKWTHMVENADKVVFLVAEYNHSYTAILKNAIDWIYKPWNDKPIGYIGYGWAGGSRAIKHLRDVMSSNIDAKSLDSEVNLYFKKTIEINGAPIGSDAKEQINRFLGEL